MSHISTDHIPHFSAKPERSQSAFPKSSRLHHVIHPTHIDLAPHALEGSKSVEWNSRAHRKNRHQTINPKTGRPRHVHGIWHKLANMRHVEYWNISWWVATAFTLGSVIWVINGFLVFLPLCAPHKYPQSDAFQSGAGWTAWLGATVFEVGSIFGLWEAWNRSDVVNFGWAVRELELSLTGDEKELENEKDSANKRKWIWISTDGKYWHELGFLAAFFQICGATIFWISGWTAIPEIHDAIQSNKPLTDGVYWAVQVIGGSGFIISGILMMIESQKRWYIPNPLSLGWNVGFWNFLGGVGFTLCGALGFAIDSSTGVEYQSGLSTFWGAWAFLIGSVIQWFEAVN